MGGYYERLQGLTLATVRDAGHMVRGELFFAAWLEVYSKAFLSIVGYQKHYVAHMHPLHTMPGKRCGACCQGAKLCTCMQVPYTQPERASYLFRQWITNAATAPNPSAAADILQ